MSTNPPVQHDEETDPLLRVIDKPKGKNGLPINNPSKPRVTVLINAYHQMPNEDPTQYNAQWWCPLEQDEQAFGPRRIKIGTVWQRIETAWVKNAGLIIFTNTEGGQLQVNPTADMIADTLKKVLYLGIDTGEGRIKSYAILRPKRSHLLEPIEGVTYYVKAAVEGTGFALWACPS
jgi:hypothetical protein